MIEGDKKQRIKTMCVFINNGKTLASKGYDKSKDETFYRVIGGNVEFGEKTEDAIRREIREELKTEIENLQLVKVVENIFEYLGQSFHDVVFLYKGILADRELYNQEKIHIIEPYAEFDAEWVSVDEILSGRTILYPALDYKDILK